MSSARPVLLTAAMTSTTPIPKIDCHAHFVPDFYHEALVESGHTAPDGMPYIPAWNPSDHLAVMSELNITKSILSISSPGTYLKQGDNSASRALTRQCNDYAAQLKRENPTKFGFWASLPLLDVAGSLAEIEYALDTINADGFTVETNCHGIYLGDARYDPIFTELNRRHAKIFVHPTTPCHSMPSQGDSSSSSNKSANPFPQYPSPMLEFFFDTARTVANLFLSGTIERFPNITYVIPHAGGALPPLINRISFMAPSLNATDPNSTNSTSATFPAFVRDRLKSQFYFDTAGWALPEPLRDLLQYVPVERIVYGSDYPWAPAEVVKGLSRTHDTHLPGLLSDADVHRVCTANAEGLLARTGGPDLGS